MSNQKNTDRGMALNLLAPFTLTQMSNGGWTIKQNGVNPTFQPPGAVPAEPTVVGAFSSAEDLLAALALAMNPPEPEKEVITEVPPFDTTNYATEWMPMSYAPRNGVYVRIEDDEGERHRPMKFTAPYWWDAPNGELRLADTNADMDMNVTRAVRWRPLDPEEDARYNSRAPITARPPLPAAFR